ncbi:MAG: SDR family oxidoreductase, partial [Bacteroidota bacterium]
AEVRGKGINVVNIYPGAILTPMWPRTYQRRFGSSMMKADEFAQLIFQLTLQPETLHIEEIVVRPRRGDLQV